MCGWCGIGVFSMAIRVKSFERGIELSNEREKLGKRLLGFCDFFLLGFVIDLLLLFLLILDLWFVQKNFLLSGYVHFFFFIAFSCFYLLNFLGQFIKILERGANYINIKAKIKILFVILLVYFFQRLGGGGGMPIQPLSSFVIGYTFAIRYYIDIDYYYYYYYYICCWHGYKKFVKHLTGLFCIWFHV